MGTGRKDFTQINTDPVYDTIAEATREARKERKIYTEQEAQEFKENLQTSGRKGVKLPRINLAFSPETYDYIKTMSRARGETLTDFVNHVLKLSLEENRDVYEKALEFRNSF